MSHLSCPVKPDRYVDVVSFQHAAPKEWNNLPLDIRDRPSLAIFKSRLKTFLFKSAFIL